MAQSDSAQATETARRLAQEKGWEMPGVTEPVTALTFYPLAGSMTLPAGALFSLAGANFRPLALGTSLAAMTIILSEDDLPRAGKCAARSLRLAPG